MDITTGHGVFLGYTASEKNVYILNDETQKVLIATHKSFDEADMSAPAEKQSSMSQSMLQAGYKNDTSCGAKDCEIDPNAAGLRVQQL